MKILVINGANMKLRSEEHRVGKDSECPSAPYA